LGITIIIIIIIDDVDDVKFAFWCQEKTCSPCMQFVLHLAMTLIPLAVDSKVTGSIQTAEQRTASKHRSARALNKTEGN